MSPKPTVYIDSNVLSVLHYDGGSSFALLHKAATRDWWALERPSFQAWTSRVAVLELTEGHYRGQPEAVAEALRLSRLPFTAAVNHCAAALKQAGIVPASHPADALHLAFAVVHRIDYLLTWNHAHLANVEVRRKLPVLCRKRGWRAPVLASPDTIPKVTLGQTIRRPDEDDAP
jgi:predicted nucleic acid-binding protein